MLDNKAWSGLDQSLKKAKVLDFCRLPLVRWAYCEVWGIVHSRI